MDEKTARSQRPDQPDRQSFPPRTNPDRPDDSGKRIDSGCERDDRRYPERCNPKRTKPPLDDDQKELATRYLPLAGSQASRMEVSFPAGGDELQAVAFLALVEAAQSFDSSRGVNFATFARLRIWGALCDFRRETFKNVRPYGNASAVVVVRLGAGSEEHGRLIGVSPDQPVGSELESLETLENWLGQLPRLHAQVFRHIYLDGKTQRETAALVGCSVWKLNRVHSEGLSCLQETIERQSEDGPSEV